jgi:hypothetical protein
MKILLSVVLALGLLLLLWWQPQDRTGQAASSEGTPWHIEQLADQSVQVFGLRLPGSRFADAMLVLGANYELAIIDSDQKQPGLELYYSRYHAGPITGKLIVSAEADEQQLQALMARAVKTTTLQNGSKQYSFDGQTEHDIGRFAVRSLSFVPTINLDETMVVSRFGEPGRRVSIDEQQSYYLYPEKGLAIWVSSDSKEMMQYVSPKRFDELIAPLLK